MRFHTYGKFSRESADAVDLQAQLDNLADFLLQSGFAGGGSSNPWGGDDLDQGGQFTPEMLEALRGDGERRLLLRADRRMLRTAPMAGPLGSSKHRQAGDSRTLRRNSRSRNTMVTVCVRVGRMRGAPVSRSAYGRPGAGGARRLQTPTPPGLAAVSVGVGSPAPAANGLRRARRARVRPASTAREYGPWRPVVGQVADKFLACGILEHGFARIRCDACAHEYLLACSCKFSCKCRYFCPSCHAKRLAVWTQWLDTTLLAPVLHRQVVLTIPKRLRAYCRYRRRLLGEIARVAGALLWLKHGLTEQISTQRLFESRGGPAPMDWCGPPSAFLCDPLR